MKSSVTVIHVPLQPVLIYDGDCNFCKYWSSRWQKNVRDTAEFFPLQDPQLKARFPEIPQQEFESAVHLIETDGAVYLGAEAVFRLLAINPKRELLLKLYTRSRIFAAVADALYHLVSRNRSFFSWIWGTHP